MEYSQSDVHLEISRSMIELDKEFTNNRALNWVILVHHARAEVLPQSAPVSSPNRAVRNESYHPVKSRANSIVFQ